MKNFLVFALLLFTSSLCASPFLIPVCWAKDYKIDPDHSSITFRIRHLVGRVKGEFKQFSGTVSVQEENLKTLQANALLQAESIDTGNKKRDNHLRSKDFFHSEKYPKITFRSLRVSETVGNQATLVGKLQMHGVTNTIALETTFHGKMKDQFGAERIGLSAKTTLDRKGFGINWNKTMDRGGLLLGDSVTIEIEIEAQAVN